MKQSSLDGARPVIQDLWSIQDIFHADELEELLRRISLAPNWEKVHLQENTPREQLAWQTDGTCDWLFGKLFELDFTRFNLRLRTVLIWKDTDGYIIKNHVDNDRVVAAMQIYLSDTFPELGTWFLDDIQIPFIQNTGYLMHNRSQLRHSTKHPVPPGYTRLSLYVLFDNLS